MFSSQVIDVSNCHIIKYLVDEILPKAKTFPKHIGKMIIHSLDHKRWNSRNGIAELELFSPILHVYSALKIEN